MHLSLDTVVKTGVLFKSPPVVGVSKMVPSAVGDSTTCGVRPDMEGTRHLDS